MKVEAEITATVQLTRDDVTKLVNALHHCVNQNEFCNLDTDSRNRLTMLYNNLRAIEAMQVRGNAS